MFLFLKWEHYQKVPFSVCSCWVENQALFTSWPAQTLPNSHFNQPYKLSRQQMEKGMCDVPWEPGYCLGELEAAVFRVPTPSLPHTLLPVNHPGTPSAGWQFCAQDVCLQALPSKSQSWRLPLPIQTPKWERGKNPGAVLLMLNTVYLYSKIATGYLSLQKLKRLGSRILKILSPWKLKYRFQSVDTKSMSLKHLWHMPWSVSINDQPLFLWAPLRG